MVISISFYIVNVFVSQMVLYSIGDGKPCIMYELATVMFRDLHSEYHLMEMCKLMYYTWSVLCITVDRYDANVTAETRAVESCHGRRSFCIIHFLAYNICLIATFHLC